MSGISTVQTNKMATCPHGLPMGACPICNGMGGGSTAKKIDEPRRPGEMTYQECYAQWKQMQRAEAQKQQELEVMLKNAQIADKIQKQLAQITNKLSDILARIEASLPKPISKTFNAIANNVIKPVLNLIKDIPKIINQIQIIAENVKNVIQQVSEKLTAIMGEVQNFIEKSISQSVKALKKRFRKILSIFGLDEEEKETDEKIKDEIKVFKEFEIEKLKEAIRKLLLSENKEAQIERHKDKNSWSKI